MLWTVITFSTLLQNVDYHLIWVSHMLKCGDIARWWFLNTLSVLKYWEMTVLVTGQNGRQLKNVISPKSMEQKSSVHHSMPLRAERMLNIQILKFICLIGNYATLKYELSFRIFWIWSPVVKSAYYVNTRPWVGTSSTHRNRDHDDLFLYC